MKKKEFKAKSNYPTMTFRLPAELRVRLQTYCTANKVKPSAVVRGLLEVLLLTPDERLKSLQAAQLDFERGVDVIRAKMEHKVRKTSVELFKKDSTKK